MKEKPVVILIVSDATVLERPGLLQAIAQTIIHPNIVLAVELGEPEVNRAAETEWPKEAKWN